MEISVPQVVTLPTDFVSLNKSDTCEEGYIDGSQVLTIIHCAFINPDVT